MSSKRILNCYCTENTEKMFKPFRKNAFFCFWSRDIGRGKMTSWTGLYMPPMSMVQIGPIEAYRCRVIANWFFPSNGIKRYFNGPLTNVTALSSVRHAIAASRKNFKNSSVYYKTKNPFEAKICMNSSFELLLYIMKVKSLAWRINSFVVWILVTSCERHYTHQWHLIQSS